jgi:hypothetical protein
LPRGLAITALLWLGLLSVCRAGDFSVDEKGRRFRVRFDPASEVRLGLMAGTAGGSEDFAAVAELDLGILYRAFAEFGDKPEDRISWQLDHRFLTGRIRPWSDGLDDLPELDLIAYTGSFLRHSAAPYMVLPTDPPQRFYFPFDVGVECSVGRVRIPSQAESPRILRLGLARASVLLDPWRSGKPGNSLEIGLGVSYDLDLVGQNSLENPAVIHRLAPFTALSVRFRLQDPDGLTTLDLRGDLTPHWASSGSWGIGAETTAHFERVLVAVNDEPVALVLEAGYQRLPPAPGFEGAHELTFLAGLAFGLQLK